MELREILDLEKIPNPGEGVYWFRMERLLRELEEKSKDK
jgi:hypothetical protein